MVPLEQPVGTTPSSIVREDDFFAKVGPLPTSYDELRRFPRFYYRTCAEITIYPLDSAAGEPVETRIVLTSDLSRGGVSLLHSASLAKGQRIDIELNGQAPRPMRVSWCHHAADGRFLIGCRFVSADAE